MGLSMRKISIISILLSIVIIFGAFQVSAENTDSDIPVLMSSSVPLTPGHTGSDYVFSGDYSDGQIRIFAPGHYHCTENLVTTSEDYAIQIENQSITLDGNGYMITGPSQNGIGIKIEPKGSCAVITNFSMISEFYKGIYSDGESVSIFNNVVLNSSSAGIHSNGKFSHIYDNFVSDVDDVCIFTFGDYSTVLNNFVMHGRNGVLNHGNYANISQNYVFSNMRYGICAGGSHAGPEPGENGKGYYAIMKNNVALLNGYIGLHNWNPHGIIQGNVVLQNAVAGIDVSYHSNNTTLSGNYVATQPIGIQITDYAQDLTLHHNYIEDHDNADLFIKSNKGFWKGAIFDNYFGSWVNVNGTGQIGNFVWTNPMGPTAGENIMGGPYIAGNYWSNPDGTGWSDMQEPSVTGYSSIPYEVLPGMGVYDIAPLVRIGHNVSSIADEWTIIHPIGNITYPRYSDPFYIIQAKPGAILNNLRIDGYLNTSTPSYTFVSIDQDHIIEAIGDRDPSQVHVRFSYSPGFGNWPLKIQFNDNSLGDPISWYWQFGDGQFSTAQNPEHTYMTPGTYTVSLRAYNNLTGGYSVCNNCITVQ